MTMINVYDLDRQKSAVLQNAFNIKEEQELNNIYSLSFDLPNTDEKLTYCSPFHYFRYGDDGKQLYRMVKNPKQNTDVGISTITCEHVIATLCDNVLFGSFTYGGTDTHTADVIRFILSEQTTQNWILKECDFDFAYEYNWEQENLLNALYSIPKVFTEPYKWVFDTSVYPWRISLKRIDTSAHPDYYIRAKRNLVADSTNLDYTNICTRIYPLGYGEGINQLNIKDVNNGKAYLDAPAAVIAQYGIKEKVLVDRQFEDATTLKAYAKTVLDAMQEPSAARSFSVVDLYPITSDDIDHAEVGKIAKLTEDGTITYITKTVRILDRAGDLQIDLSTKPTDVASAIADLADRVRIESVYAQGATQLYQHSKDANATPSKGMVLSLYFPKEMKQINKVLLKLKLNRFRSYSQATSTEPTKTQTTSYKGSVVGTTGTSGAFKTAVTSSSSSKNTTENSNLGTEPTSIVDAGLFPVHYHNLSGSTFVHNHKMEHTHEVSIDISEHRHSVSIPAHDHTVEIPAHYHKISAGIFESGSPKFFDIYVNGTKKATVNSTSYEDDITMWLLGTDGLVMRDRWIEMEIRPDDNAYVVASVFVQGFVQSRGGGNY